VANSGLALMLTGMLFLLLHYHLKMDHVNGMVLITLVSACIFEVLLWVILRQQHKMEKRRWEQEKVLLLEKHRQTAVLEATVAERTHKLAESLMQMRALLESSNDGILSVDVDCRVNFLNPAAEIMLGVSAEHVSGQPVGQVLQVGGRDGLPIGPESGLLGEALRSGSSVRADSQTLWRINHTSFPAECVATPIYVAQKMKGVLLTFRDTSERIEIDRMKSEFVSIVSHELRTPLASIRGVLGLLSGGKLGGVSAETKPMVDLAVRNADRLSRLINSIVDVERLESGQLRLQQVFTTSSEIVRRTTEQAHALADEAGVTLNFAVENMPLQLDLERVLQALMNLISNAVKYSERGQTVTVMIKSAPEAVHFSVTDQGPGIAPEKQGKVFERFYQGDSSDMRGKGGTGLGLTIARGIVLRHGGRIWVESEPGKGTTFHFSLPQRRKRKPDDEIGLGLS